MTPTNKLAKNLRKNSTDSEKILWHHIRNKSFLGYKFRRQFPIGKYVADFICFEKNLIIELVGSEHLEKNAVKDDEIRTEYLNSQGYKVIRYLNSDVMNNIDSVLENLRLELISPSPALRAPSPLKGEGSGKSPSSAKKTPQHKNEKSEKSPTIANNKNAIRKWAKEKRAMLNMKALSISLVQKLVKTDTYKSAKNIMLFYPLKNEVNLLSLLEDKTKTFYLPKIDGENLLCCKFDSETELCESCFSTKEPTSTPQLSFSPDLIIVPALAVDRNNYRLGYGKGFYDRFLGINNLKMKSVVCIPKQLIVETVYPEAFDIPVNMVITA